MKRESPIPARWSTIGRRASLIAVCLAALGPAASLAAAAALPLTQFPVPTHDSGVTGIAAAPDGSIWFTETTAGKIGRIAPDGTITEYPLSTLSRPDGIAIAADGTVWFTETGTDAIGEITPSGTPTSYSIPGKVAPGQIAVDAEGVPWFTEPAANAIGSLTVTGGVATFTTVDVPTPGADPGGIVAAPGGALYFTEAAVTTPVRAQYLGSLSGGVIDQLPLPTIAGGAGAIVIGPDGAPWFSEPEAGGAGDIETLAATWAPPGGAPDGLALAGDGRLWFNLTAPGAIGWLSPGAADGITEYGVAGAGGPSPAGSANTMTAAPNDAIWFTESGANAVDRVTLSPPSITAASSLALAPGTPVDVTVTTTGWPVPTLAVSGALPAGLAFHDNGDGTATIAGTPAVSTAGEAGEVAVTATNSFPAPAIQMVSFTIASATGTSPTTTTTPTTTSTTPAPTATAKKTTARRGRAHVRRVRIGGAVVRVTVQCAGRRGSHGCAIVARLQVSGTRVTARHTIRVGHSHTLTLRVGGRLARRLAQKTPARVRATLTVAETGVRRLILRRTVRF